MVNITIDGRDVQVEEGLTILEAAGVAGVRIPSLCFMEPLNDVGACRVCCVEVEGESRLVAACNTSVWDGMVIHTDSPKAHRARVTNVELMLSRHNCNCPTCVRSGNCELQRLANDLGLVTELFEKELSPIKDDPTFPLQRAYDKCVSCLRCVNVCDKMQGVHVWDLINSGPEARVDVADHLSVTESDCTLCGQCITHCPVGCLTARDDTGVVEAAIADPDKVVLAQIAPAVRTSWHEGIGLDRELATTGRMVAAAKALGFDYVFDTDFSADVTIMEEGYELLHKLQHRDEYQWPMFTSCCPGWIRYAKGKAPDFVDRISSTKSPQQIFGALAKTYFAERAGVDPEKLFLVSIMPCVAKKAEADYESMLGATGKPDVDAVLTVREFERMIRAHHLDVAKMDEASFDDPMGIATGAGHIFGVTGGVMEAALRTAYSVVTGENPDPEALAALRERDGWRVGTFDMGGTQVRVGVAHGLVNAEKLLQAIRDGKEELDFVEIMACPGGCTGGGGNPIHDGQELAADRAGTLYALDQDAELRFSHENPQVKQCYEEFLGEPNSELAEKLLHTDHHTWTMPNEAPLPKYEEVPGDFKREPATY